MITDYHAKYFAHELSKRHFVAGAEKLVGTLLNAQVDMNHRKALLCVKSLRTLEMDFDVVTLLLGVTV